MKIIMNEERMRSLSKRLRKVLANLGVELKHTECLELAAKLCGFENWRQYCLRDPDEPLSPLDHDLSEKDFGARDAFQMGVLQAAGLSKVARELLDRASPTGSWAQSAQPVLPATFGGNDPGRWSAEASTATER
ncbi:glyoxalase superfamily protein [Bradyrhizobium diazoefficiens]|nr:hypothetical protein XF15B_24190 [Bradyrhizobium diazoefficiens]